MDKVSDDPKQHPQGNAVKDPDHWVTPRLNKLIGF